MTRRIWVVLASIWFFLSGIWFANVAHTAIPVQARRAHYALQSDLWGYPYTLKLRHCAPAEDTLATLKMVEYRPADSVVIYRCVRP